MNAGRYSTDNVKNWVMDEGFEDDSLEEATNLQYRLLNFFPVKGWNESELPKGHMGRIQEYLFNKDLVKEVVAAIMHVLPELRRK